MVSKGILWLIAAGGVSIAALGQNPLTTTPIPGDPLEMVSGPILPTNTEASRADAIRLLDRARSNYALRSAGRGYDLKVSFTVNSGGQTKYDGNWNMEDVFVPKLGHRWTAKASASYSITRISSNGKLYGEETGNYVPLRLQEARAALFDPIPSAAHVARASIRMASAVVNGAEIACVLLAGKGTAETVTPGRHWDETEECIDPQSGLLLSHSQVPGRYYAYDYTNAPRLAGRELPGKVTVTEAGQTVTVIKVKSLTELPTADSTLFAPSAGMMTRGRATRLSGAQKIWHYAGPGRFPPGATAQIVCVFGVVTPDGKLVEAHSLQPSDPNSQAAVDAAKNITFPHRKAEGEFPQQHFVFILEKFPASQ